MSDTFLFEDVTPGNKLINIYAGFRDEKDRSTEDVSLLSADFCERIKISNTIVNVNGMFRNIDVNLR